MSPQWAFLKRQRKKHVQKLKNSQYNEPLMVVTLTTRDSSRVEFFRIMWPPSTATDGNPFGMQRQRCPSAEPARQMEGYRPMVRHPVNSRCEEFLDARVDPSRKGVYSVDARVSAAVLDPNLTNPCFPRWGVPTGDWTQLFEDGCRYS